MKFRIFIHYIFSELTNVLYAYTGVKKIQNINPSYVKARFMLNATNSNFNGNQVLKFNQIYVLRRAVTVLTILKCNLNFSVPYLLRYSWDILTLDPKILTFACDNLTYWIVFSNIKNKDSESLQSSNSKLYISQTTTANQTTV